MQAISYFLLAPLIYAASLLPFPVLYLLSDLLYLILYKLFSYRRGVVQNNLRNAFPEKEAREIKQIERNFYSFLFDVMVETIKALTISRSALKRRCTIAKPNFFQQYHASGQRMIVVMGHLGNWEYAGLRSCLETDHAYKYIYQKLSNKWFDGLFRSLRGRFGAQPVPMEQIYRNLASEQGISVTAFITDQAPPPEGALWLTFLNQDTPVFKGTERIASKLDIPVVYGGVHRLRRGHYEIRLKELAKNPAGLEEGTLTELHTRQLEADIHASPETWLWSHKRWKHKRPRSDS
jgi:KDO2-lipid IV(A) lauroyltransferase